LKKQASIKKPFYLIFIGKNGKSSTMEMVLHPVPNCQLLKTAKLLIAENKPLVNVSLLSSTNHDSIHDNTAIYFESFESR
jgi:hypothetical protein